MADNTDNQITWNTRTLLKRTGISRSSLAKAERLGHIKSLSVFSRNKLYLVADVMAWLTKQR